jgi:Tfp pilus assembly protein PilV
MNLCNSQNSARKSGFTFVEVLAAMLFLAILVPTLVAGLSASNRRGEMAERSALAAQLAENKLNELSIDNAWSSAESRGTFGDDYPNYRYELTQSQWDADTNNKMTELTLDAFFPVQGREQSVRLTTLVNSTTLTTGSSSSSSF